MSRSSKLLPGTWKFPGWKAIGNNLWDTRKNAPAFPPKVWGYGWSLNFAYPLNKKNPLWKRALVFVIGLVTLLLIVYLVVVLALLAYYALTPQQPQTLTLVLTPDMVQ